MDALSELLRVVRFSGGLFLEANFRAPWCVRSHISAEDCQPRVQPGSALLAFHYVLDGDMQVRLGKEEPRPASAGKIILLSHNDPHLLGSDVSLPAVDARPLMRKLEQDDMARIDFGAGEQIKNRFVCGFLATTMRNHPLLAALPSLLVADLRGKPSAEWAETSFRYAAREHASRRDGSQEILARLSEMLFVEAVRGYIESLPGDAIGWLAAPARSSAVAGVERAPHAARAPVDGRRTGERGVPFALGICGAIHDHHRIATDELPDALADAAGGAATERLGRHHRASGRDGRVRVRIDVLPRVQARNGSGAGSLAKERGGVVELPIMRG